MDTRNYFGLSWFDGGVLVANKNAASSVEKSLLEVKLKHIEAAAQNFSLYSSALNRMKVRCDELAKTQREGKSDPEDTSRRSAELLRIAEKERNPARASIFGHLAAISMFADSATREAIADYKSWDQLQVNQTCDRLPHLPEWLAKQEKVLDSLREEFSRIAK